MINLSYRHIIKILDLVDSKASELQKQKSRLSTVSPIDALRPDMNEIDTSDIDKEIELIEYIRSSFSEEINKVEFSFGLTGSKVDSITGD